MQHNTQHTKYTGDKTDYIDIADYIRLMHSNVRSGSHLQAKRRTGSFVWVQCQVGPLRYSI